jgi:hypothetical protein
MIVTDFSCIREKSVTIMDALLAASRAPVRGPVAAARGPISTERGHGTAARGGPRALAVALRSAVVLMAAVAATYALVQAGAGQMPPAGASRVHGTGPVEVASPARIAAG